MTKLYQYPPAPLAHALASKVSSYVKASKSQNTLRAYRVGWQAFCNWCWAKGFEPLPASPELVASFVADQADTHKVSTLNLRLAAIRHAHVLAGHISPTRSAAVALVMEGIRRCHGTAPVKKAALLARDIKVICQELPDDLRGSRDRCLILLGFCGGLRRSELVNIDVVNLAFAGGGIRLTITKSKTDQHGRGRSVGICEGSGAKSCPVAATRQWLSVSGIVSGPLFRPVNRYGALGETRLSCKSVARIVKARAQAVGLNPGLIAGHSLRSGFATSAAAAGVEERDIAKVTGHRSVNVLRGYIQDANVFNGVVKRIGL